MLYNLHPFRFIRWLFSISGYYFFFAGLSLFFAGKLAAQTDISGYCSCFSEKGADYSFSEIKGRPSLLQTPLPGIAQWKAIWVSCKVPAAGLEDSSARLHIGLFDRATLYRAGQNGDIHQSENGKLVPAAERGFAEADAFELVLDPNQDSLQFWLHIRHQYPLFKNSPPQLLLFGKDEYAEWRGQQTDSERSILYQWGIAQGIMLAFMIFPLALYWLDRQPYYLYYIAYVLLVAVNDQIEFERFSLLEFWASHRPEFFLRFLNLFQIAAIGFYVAFFRKFLQLKEKIPWLDRLLRYLILYCVLVFVGDFAVSILGFANGQNHILYWLTRVPTSVVAMISVAAIMRWKQLDSRFVCLGVLCWMAGVGLAFAANGGAFPIEWLSGAFSNPYIFIHLGVMLELFFFSLAMSYRNHQHILSRRQAEGNLSAIRQTHQLELERISSDLHDEIGSTLSSISILGDSTLQNLQTDLDQNRLSLIGERARQVMDTMSDIVWSVNPRNDNMAKVLQRMKEFAVEILENQGIALHFEAGEAAASLNLPMEKRKDFYLLFKEAVNNAAKYSQASEVWVRVSAENGALSLEVRDNGRGFDPAQVKLGNGLWNMQRRAERMGGKLELESAVGRGTRIWLMTNS